MKKCRRVRSLDLIRPQPTLVESIRALDGYKVIYTGSPTTLVERMLQQLGFAAGGNRRSGFGNPDFDLTIGWEDPDLYPVKWSCSSMVFDLILQRFGCSPTEGWSVGDDWTTDLQPAKHIGMKTVQIGAQEGSPDVHFPSVKEFLDHRDIWIPE